MATIDVIECENWVETQQYESMALKKSKAPQKEKTPRQIVESLHLTTMVVSYICHFATYSTSEKQVT
jgi:hypothetical protein